MGVFSDALHRDIKRYGREIFDEAWPAALQQVRQSADTPWDAGVLRRGIEEQDRSVTGEKLRITIISTAVSDKNFPYPEYLNSVKRVEPTKAKYLKFKIGDDWVTSKGFENKHFHWWERAWGIVDGVTKWETACRDAFEKVKF